MNKASTICDYISFILPISQLNNTIFFNKFDLIYSEDLGILEYSDRKTHNVLNIYKKSSHKKSNIKFDYVTICRQDNKQYDNFIFDIRMCYWGNGSAGKILEKDEKYAGEYKIKINAVGELKNKIMNLLLTVNWKDELKHIAMLRIKQYDIINIIKKYIPETVDSKFQMW